MCGIAGFVIRKPGDSRPLDGEKLLSELLREIDHRGGDATGFVARNPSGEVEWHKASCDVFRFLPHRRAMPNRANVALAHTRYATQGHESFPENNHPIQRGSMFVIHNGIVTNDSELFANVGRERYGQVDSEAIAAVLSHTGSLVESPELKNALGTIAGSAAIAAMDERDGTVLLARLSGSPLYVLETRRVIVWGSTAQAVTAAHTAAIGSVGRAKVETIAEGVGIVIRDGRSSRFTFTPKYTPVRTYVPAPSTAGSSYLPMQSRSFGESWQWTDDVLVNPDVPDETPPVSIHQGGGRCELCGDRVPDVWSLYDGDDDWDLCEQCWNQVTVDSPSFVKNGGRR